MILFSFYLAVHHFRNQCDPKILVGPAILPAGTNKQMALIQMMILNHMICKNEADYMKLLLCKLTNSDKSK